MPEQVTQIIEALMPYVITVVTAIAGYVAVVIKNKLAEKIDTETKKEVVEATVKYVQQVYSALDGPEKLQKALDTSIDWLNEKGIKINEAEATILIEAAVKGFKNSWETAAVETPKLGEATVVEAPVEEVSKEK